MKSKQRIKPNYHGIVISLNNFKVLFLILLSRGFWLITNKAAFSQSKRQVIVCKFKASSFFIIFIHTRYLYFLCHAEQFCLLKNVKATDAILIIEMMIHEFMIEKENLVSLQIYLYKPILLVFGY